MKVLIIMLVIINVSLMGLVASVLFTDWSPVESGQKQPTSRSVLDSDFFGGSDLAERERKQELYRLEEKIDCVARHGPDTMFRC